MMIVQKCISCGRHEGVGSKGGESLRGLTCLSDLVKDSRSQSFFQAAHQGALPACAQRLSAPKRCLEMLRSLACGLDTPDGEALPPGLHLLSDWQEECQNCLYGRPFLSFPNTAASSGSWDLVLWALEQWTGAGSQGPSPDRQTDVNDPERHREGVGGGSLSLCPLFISWCKEVFAL